jgi:1-acyl-sn-glycerol-3-phosphate acyltransferase
MTKVSRGLARVGRLAGTGFSFLSFGVGAVIMAGVFLPIAARLPGADRGQGLTAQRWISRAFQLFVRMGTLLRLWIVRFEGDTRFDQGPSLIVANHPTLMDGVFLLSRVQADCVVKKEAWRNPALRGIVEAAGYVPNDDGAALIDACAERLEAGRSVLLFPEGSRSPANGLNRFKRGAARVALRTDCRILPVFVTCQPPALMKGQPWYSLPNEVLRFTFRVGEPVYARDLVPEGVPPAKAARRVTDTLASFFREGLDRAAAC